MRTLGMILLFGGFLAAAFVSVRHADTEFLAWETIDWMWYAPGFLVGVAGVVILRVTAQQTATHAHKLDADLQQLRAALDTLVEKLAGMNAGREQIDVYDVHRRIDAELTADLAAFVEAREALIPTYGLQEYANLMNEFALGERNINRAWSASADGYIDEVWKSLQIGEQRMRAAQQLLNEYEEAAGRPIPTGDPVPREG
jgi:hypothetical protein